MIKKSWILIASLAIFAIGCSGGESEAGGTKGEKGGMAPAGETGKSEPTTPATATASYIDVQEILTKNCIGCHGDTNPKEELSLTSYESLMKGGEHGPVVVPGDPDNSRIVQAIHGGHDIKRMPLNGDPLPEEDVKKIEDWIRAGAKQES